MKLIDTYYCDNRLTKLPTKTWGLCGPGKDPIETNNMVIPSSYDENKKHCINSYIIFYVQITMESSVEFRILQKRMAKFRETNLT